MTQDGWTATKRGRSGWEEEHPVVGSQVNGGGSAKARKRGEQRRKKGLGCEGEKMGSRWWRWKEKREEERLMRGGTKGGLLGKDNIAVSVIWWISRGSSWEERWQRDVSWWRNYILPHASFFHLTLFSSPVLSPLVFVPFNLSHLLSVIIHCLFQHAFKPELSWLGYGPNLVHNSSLWSTVSCWLPSSQCHRYGSAPQSHLLLTNSCDGSATEHSLTSGVIVSGAINTQGAVNGSPGCRSFTRCQWFDRVQLLQTLMNLNVSANVLLHYKVNLISGVYPCNHSLFVCALCLKPDTECGATHTFSFEVWQVFLSHAAVKKRISKKALKDGYHSLFIKITWLAHTMYFGLGDS